MSIVKFEAVEDNILTIRGVQVILDSDVAELYGVETRDINKAVKNNPDKFPDAYIFELDADELDDLRCKFSTAKFSKTRVSPKVGIEFGANIKSCLSALLTLKGACPPQKPTEAI